MVDTPERKGGDGTELTAQLVHDLRNPLASIRSAARLLVRAKNDPEVIDQLARGICNQVDEAVRLLNTVAEPEDDRKHSGAAPAAACPDHRSVRVLIADDNSDAATTLAMFLRTEGHSVTVARDGNEALLLATQEHPEVMVLDISMPDKDGYEVAREIRAQEWSSSSRLIAVSGWGGAENQRRAMSAGFDAHLTKPIDVEALNRLVGH